MIMWRSRSAVVAFVWASLFLHAACGPDLNDIHLSECMKDCNDTAGQCLDSSNARLAKCNNDQACLLEEVKASEACLTSCLDCIDACIAETEATLKK